MNSTCAYQLGSSFCIKLLQVWEVLEIVCIQIAGIQSQVRLYIVRILYNL